MPDLTRTQRRVPTDAKMRSAAMTMALMLLMALCSSTIVLLARAALPLAPEDSALLCALQPLLHTALPPSPTPSRVAALQRLATLAALPTAEAARALPGVSEGCMSFAATELALAAQRASEAAKAGLSAAGERSTDEDLRQWGVGAVQLVRSIDLPAGELLDVSGDSAAAPHTNNADVQRGYHRQLHTTLRITSPSDAAPLATRLAACEVLLLDVIPDSMYVDLYQLSSLARERAEQQQHHQNGGAAAPRYPPVRALAPEDFDVEKPRERSDAQLLFLRVDKNARWTPAMPTTKAEGAYGEEQMDAAVLRLQWPIHARYQAARNVTCGITQGADDLCLRPAVMEPPQIFLRCHAAATPASTTSTDSPPPLPATARMGVPTDDLSRWLLLPLSSPAEAATVRMQVPIASTRDAAWVRAATLALSIGAALALSVAVMVWSAKGWREADEAKHHTQ